MHCFDSFQNIYRAKSKLDTDGLMKIPKGAFADVWKNGLRKGKGTTTQINY